MKILSKSNYATVNSPVPIPLRAVAGNAPDCAFKIILLPWDLALAYPLENPE